VDEPPPDAEPDLRQYLPPVFQETLATLLGEGVLPSAVLFVPSSQILCWTPGRALVLLNDGVLCMEEGESVILDQKWGVKTSYYPYGQIAGLEIGNALLQGRFTVLGTGSARPFEFELAWRDLNNFRAAARLIRQRIGLANRQESGAGASFQNRTGGRSAS
jgi:hypothetical protein